MIKRKTNIDYSVIIIPLIIIAIVSALIMIFPTQATNVLSNMNTFLTERLGSYYLIVGLAFVSILVWLSLSKYGKIKLGEGEKQYSNLSWGAMIFTSTMAADILFYALHEWSYYYQYGSNAEESEMLAREYPLFHWGFIPWSFYLLPAIAYAFMMYVDKRDHRQRISEACRPILGKHSEGVIGKAIDIVSIVGLIAGTATTFSVATPLISTAISYLTGIPNNKLMTIIILLVVAIVYTIAVLSGFKGISKLSTICTVFFITLLGIFLVASPSYIIESGFSGVGGMLSKFLERSTWTDPGRYNSIPQTWTIFYWAYWIAWCVANPFFIAKISKGRTVRNTAVGGMIAGLLGTFTSFIILGGFGQYQQHIGNIDVVLESGVSTPSELIIKIIQQLPLHRVALVVLVITMICLYSTTFDAMTHVMSSYCYKSLGADESPSKKVLIYWAALFVMLPIALIFSEQTNSLLMTVSIIGALPISLILLLVVASFIKLLKKRSNING